MACLQGLPMTQTMCPQQQINNTMLLYHHKSECAAIATQHQHICNYLSSKSNRLVPSTCTSESYNLPLLRNSWQYPSEHHYKVTTKNWKSNHQHLILSILQCVILCRYWRKDTANFNLMDDQYRCCHMQRQKIAKSLQIDWQGLIPHTIASTVQSRSSKRCLSLQSFLQVKLTAASLNSRV